MTPAIVNDGQIVANFTDTLSVAANISGIGTLSKAGAGTLILTGNNDYTGGTTINGGTLQLGNGGTSGTLSGNVANNGAFATQPLDAFTFGGVISGSGVVQQLGPGTTTLTANNTYTGGTVVNAGILQLGAGARSRRRALTVNGGAFNLNNNNQTVGALAGTGGASPGQRHADGGRRQQHHAASAITGTGGFTKQGCGILNLTGTNTYTGGTAVTAGTLAVNGSLASNVTVGAGRHAGRQRHRSAAWSPTAACSPPATRSARSTVNGNFVQAAGSTYQVEANAAGQSDRINVGGTATINGGTVQVLAAAGQLRPQHDLHHPERHRRRAAAPTPA